MRVYLRLNVSKEEERLIARWLARYHRGAKRHSIMKACLAAGARAFFEPGLVPTSTPAVPPTALPAHTPAPVVIPSFADLGALIQTQQTTRTTRPPGGPDDPAA